MLSVTLLLVYANWIFVGISYLWKFDAHDKYVFYSSIIILTQFIIHCYDSYFRLLPLNPVQV